MNMTAIVQALWVAFAFSTALIAGQALTQSSGGNQTPAPFQSAVTGSFDAGAESPAETSIVNGDANLALYWHESL
jgi:hypothetical protein